MTYRITGSATAHPQPGPAPSTTDTTGYRVKGSAVAHPCPDGPAAPTTDTTGYRVKGSNVWRAPCTETTCDCGITDTFTRTTSSGDLGPSDAGYLWYHFDSGFTSFVDGSRANLVQTEGWFLPYVHRFADVTVEFEFSGEGQFELNVAANNWDAVARHTPSEGGFLGHQWLAVGDPSFDEELVGFAWVSGVVYRMHLVVDPAGGHLNAWEASSSEPAGWMVEVLNGPFSETGEIRIINGNPNGNPYGPIYVSQIDTVGVNSCVFDSFQRTESGVWGDATPSGFTWTTVASEGPVTPSVEPGSGLLTFGPPNGGFISMETAPGGPWSSGRFVMRTLVRQWASRNEAVTFYLANAAIAGTGSWSTWFELANQPLYAELNTDPDNGEFAFYDGVILDGDYYVVWDHDVGSHSRAKWWLVGDPEPVDWIVSRTALLDPPVDATWTFGISATNYDKTIAYISFDTCP